MKVSASTQFHAIPKISRQHQSWRAIKRSWPAQTDRHLVSWARMSSSDLDRLQAEGEAHYAAGRREEARAAFAQVLRLREDHPIALHALGWLAHEAGDEVTAE